LRLTPPSDFKLGASSFKTPLFIGFGLEAAFTGATFGASITFISSGILSGEAISSIAWAAITSMSPLVPLILNG